MSIPHPNSHCSRLFVYLSICFFVCLFHVCKHKLKFYDNDINSPILKQENWSGLENGTRSVQCKCSFLFGLIHAHTLIKCYAFLYWIKIGNKQWSDLRFQLIRFVRQKCAYTLYNSDRVYVYSRTESASVKCDLQNGCDLSECVIRTNAVALGPIDKPIAKTIVQTRAAPM